MDSWLLSANSLCPIATTKSPEFRQARHYQTLLSDVINIVIKYYTFTSNRPTSSICLRKGIFYYEGPNHKCLSGTVVWH